MSLFHGIEETKKTKVGSGAVYIKREKYCAVHGWIDLFLCSGAEWEAAHGKCESVEASHKISLKTSPKRAA